MTWPIKVAKWTNKRKYFIIIGVVVCVCYMPNLPWILAYKVLPTRDSFSMQFDKSTPNLSAVLYDGYDQKDNVIKENKSWAIEEILNETMSNDTVNGGDHLNRTNALETENKV